MMKKSFGQVLPPAVESVMEKILSNGHSCYVVGGAVRDFLLSLPVKDFDITTSATPEQIRRMFPRTVPLGAKHGTVTVIEHSEQIEITTFRNQPPEGSSNPFAALKADLHARDFTINAMAWTSSVIMQKQHPDVESYGDGYIVDPFGGRDDLQRRVLRVTGGRGENFTDDPLRILRGCRMVSALSLTIEPETLREMIARSSCITATASERVFSELWRIFEGPAPWDAISLLLETGLSRHIFPLEATKCNQDLEDRGKSLLAGVKTAFSGKNPWPGQGPFSLRNVGIALLVHYLSSGDNPAAWFKARRYPVSDARFICQLLRLAAVSPKEYKSPPQIRKLFSQYPPDCAGELCAFWAGVGMKDVHAFAKRSFAVLSSTTCLSVKDLAIDGKTLIERAGVAPGPMLGKILNQLLDEVLAEPDLNVREILLERAISIYNTMTDI